MPDAQILGVWAAEPSSPWTPISSFHHFAPEFGVVVHIGCDPDLVQGSGAYPPQDFVGYDLLVQFVNRAEDPSGGSEWWRWAGTFRAAPTVDYMIRGLTFPATDFGLVVTWPGRRYGDAMRAVGNGVSPGVYALRASLQAVRRQGQVGFVDLKAFSASDDEAFRYEILP